MDPGDAPGIPVDDPVALAGLEDRALRGSGLAAQVAGQPGLGRATGDRDPLAAQGDAGVERDGSPLEAYQAGDVGRSGDAHGRSIRDGRLSVHYRPEPVRSPPQSRGPVGELLVDEVDGLSKNFCRSTYWCI